MYLPYFDKFKNNPDYLTIEPEDWTYIKETFSKEDVRESLAAVAHTYPMPIPVITEEDAYREFRKLKGMKWNDLCKNGEWFSRGTYEYKFSDLYLKRTNIGNAASNYFQVRNRWSVGSAGFSSPEATWKSTKELYTVMGSAYSLKVPGINRPTLRTMIELRKYICTQFKPNVAKVLYDYYKAKNILDFSMGWGDRLAGFYASDFGENYVGLDPRKENHPIYNKQAEFYKSKLTFFEHQRNSTFHCSPAEDFDFLPYTDYFDLVFTSPPYFNVERYSNDDNQSWVRYKQINEWNELFLHKVLHNLWPAVRSGGIVMINISDVYNNKSKEGGWHKICDPMNDYLKSLGGEYLGCIGMEMAKRPNNGGAKTAVDERNWSDDMRKTEETDSTVFCEPVWTWRKK